MIVSVKYREGRRGEGGRITRVPRHNPPALIPNCYPPQKTRPSPALFFLPLAFLPSYNLPHFSLDFFVIPPSPLLEPLMNHAYRIVKNAATGLWQAVSETARANGKCVGG